MQYYSLTALYSLATVCPRSSDPFYSLSYYIKWVTSSWTYSKTNLMAAKLCFTAAIHQYHLPSRTDTNNNNAQENLGVLLQGNPSYQC